MQFVVLGEGTRGHVATISVLAQDRRHNAQLEGARGSRVKTSYGIPPGKKGQMFVQQCRVVCSARRVFKYYHSLLIVLVVFCEKTKRLMKSWKC